MKPLNTFKNDRSVMMKNLFFALLVICAVSCKTEKIAVDGSAVNPANIYGKWNWVQSSGGFAGKNMMPASEGYTLGIEIKNNNTFYFYQNDTLKSELKFAVTKGRSIFSEEPVYIIKPRDGGIEKVIMTAKSDTLVLADNVNDGFAATYVKQK